MGVLSGTELWVLGSSAAGLSIRKTRNACRPGGENSGRHRLTKDFRKPVRLLVVHAFVVLLCLIGA